jgi:NAD(P)-dependent dehydrogenase (short-subunit alcohol dehydrogenase family)
MDDEQTPVTVEGQRAVVIGETSGIGAFTRVAAKELGPAIRVTAIRPGLGRSTQTTGAYDEGTDRHGAVATAPRTGGHRPRRDGRDGRCGHPLRQRRRELRERESARSATPSYGLL